ncbi:MAG TPA: protein kinase [Planctomycetota bacterium]|nr:protein kinase [Planctomycetota bacterium]
MEDRKPSVTCTCGRSFSITPEEIFQDVACPSCGKIIVAPKATPKADPASGPKTDPLAPKATPSVKADTGLKKAPPPAKADAGPKTDPLAPKVTPPPKAETGPKTDPFAPKVASPPKSDTGPKTDPFAPKGDTTKGTGTPNTARKAPLFVKDGPLPDPIPGYTFQKRLGQGGMGEVFLAKQESLDRLVAIKLLPPDLSKDKVYVESFMKEARSAGKVTHENIMGAVDVGESLGRYYFVMEYVQGETVFRLIRQQKTIPEAKALEIGRQVARGLRHAQQSGLIHRDIKPQNILITPEGQAKICDFGLATELKSSEAVKGEDEENVHTTPAYASPEQCRAEPLDHRTDMYSLGVTLYEMLSGRRPFIANTPRELMTKQVTETPQPPKAINPAISDGANALVLRLLKKHKDERFKTYDELLKAFEGLLLTPTPKTVRATPDAADARAAGAKKKLLLIGGGAAAAIVLIVLLAVAFRSKPAAPPADPSAGQNVEIQRRFDDMKATERNAKGRPGEYATVRTKWKALEDQFAGSPHRALFAGGRVDWEAYINSEAESAAKDAIDEATKALDDGHPGDALTALHRFPGEFSGTPAGSRVSAKALEIERAADDRFRDALASINVLVTAGRLDDARQKLVTLRATAALDAGGQLRPQVKSQMDDLLRRIDTAIADPKNKPADPVASNEPVQPSIKNPAPAPSGQTPGPPLDPGLKTSEALAVLPAAALPHYGTLRDPAERRGAEKRLAAAIYFRTGAPKSAFHHAADIFLSRDEAAWKLDGPAAAGLQEYLNSPELNHAEGGRRSEGMTPERHQKLLELLIQKIAEAGTAPVDALQLFACAHIQELQAKKGKIDTALLLQGKFAKGPILDLWGPAASVVRVELASLLLRPPGLWVTRAAESASIAGDFPTRYLGALCTLKDSAFDAASAMERWKKLSSGAPDAAAWAKLCDAVADRIKIEMTCEMCLGQGRISCSACGSTGAMLCVTCRGTGKVSDPSEGTNVTCKTCQGRRAVACTICLGQKGMKCPLCDGKKTRPQLTGTHYRMILELGLCETCQGAGSLYTGVAYPCPACDGNGRVLEAVLKDFAKLPPWVMKSREGRLLYGALRWLARHQSVEGFWGSTTWTASCPEPGCRAAPAAGMDVGVTSLALAAFLNAGFTPDSTVEFGSVPVGGVVKKAIAWLVSQQAPEGLIMHGTSARPIFENHLATWALFTAAQLITPSEAFPEKDRSALRETALRALKWSLNNQGKGGGWGSAVGTASDTWVTSWGALALLAARDAGVDIPRLNLGYILQWYDAVTDKKDFHIGFAPTTMGKVTGDTFAHHETLSAFGSLARMQIEGKPSSTYAAADKLIEKDLPNPDPLRRDYCYWYFATVYTAFHEQRRGTLWNQWSQALLREELSLEESVDTCAMGSFPNAERWSASGGRVYGAAINALTLAQVIGTRPAPPTKK